MLTSLFETPPVRWLLDLELAAIAPELAGLHGAQGLFLRATASAPHTLSAPLLERISGLHVAAPRRLGGDLSCDPAALPFEGDSFRMVLMQHAAEVVADSHALLSEVARVLMPEGVVLILGFHPASLWRPWLYLRAREGLPATLRSPVAWQRDFARIGVDIHAIRRVGPLWPRTGSVRAPRVTLNAPRASYLLIARKRRAALTPLVPKPQRKFRLKPTLASGAHRVRA